MRQALILAVAHLHLAVGFSARAPLALRPACRTVLPAPIAMQEDPLAEGEPAAAVETGLEAEAEETKEDGAGFDLVDAATVLFGLSVLLSFGGIKLFGDIQPW